MLYAQVEVTTLTDPFDGSGEISLGPDGQIYIGDYGEALINANGTVVRRYNVENGLMTLFASGLQGASGNAFDSEGNLYQANLVGNYLAKITPDGTVSNFSSEGISCPLGVTVDDQDNIYVSNCCGVFGNSIRKIAPDGTSTAYAASNLMNCPIGIDIDKDGNLYVSSFNNSWVFKIDTEGTVSQFASIPGDNNGYVHYNETLDVLFVASHGSSRVYQVTMDGTVSVVAGTGVRGNDDGLAEEATFSRPNGLAATPSGDTLYLNCSVPLTNVNFPFNPSILRRITGINPPTSLDLEWAYDGLQLTVSPNPLIHDLSISYTLPQAMQVEFWLVNVHGQRLHQWSLGEQSAGEYRLDRIIDVPAGIYELVLVSKDVMLSRRILCQP